MRGTRSRWRGSPFRAGLRGHDRRLGGSRRAPPLSLRCRGCATGSTAPWARATAKTDRGGFLDIVFDFVFYGAVPLGFALRDPALFGLPAAVLLFAFYVNGASFLAFAAVAAKRGMESAARGVKSIYFTAGLAEGTETILAFALMILFPAWFPLIAYAFAGLTLMTAISRVAFAWVLFREEEEEEDEERR